MNRDEYLKALKDLNRKAQIQVQMTLPPSGQKYPPGTRVRIADDLGPSMDHFPKGMNATVLYTYAHAYGGDESAAKQYCLDIDGYGSVSWYDEDQLERIGHINEN